MTQLHFWRFQVHQVGVVSQEAFQSEYRDILVVPNNDLMFSRDLLICIKLE